MHTDRNIYSVSTQVFEGPLDLLLSLVEHAELDITTLALARVTDQFLNYLSTMQTALAEEVSAFIVIAAKLLQIKSEVLLPRGSMHEAGEEENIGESLVQQLIIYKRYKKIANFLFARESSGKRTYLRLAASPVIDGSANLDGLTIDDLMDVARLALDKEEKLESLNSVVVPQRISIRQKIHDISILLKQFGSTTFKQIIELGLSKTEIVVTFLAVLELMKQRAIIVTQEGLFGEINIQPLETWVEDDKLELEFDE